MQAVREARSVSHPVWSHYMLLKPNPGVRFTHCKKTQTGLSVRLFDNHEGFHHLFFIIMLCCHVSRTHPSMKLGLSCCCCCCPGLPVEFCPTGSQSLPCWLAAGRHHRRSPPQTTPKNQSRLVYFCWMAFFTSDSQLLHTSPPSIRVHQLYWIIETSSQIFVVV